MFLLNGFEVVGVIFLKYLRSFGICHGISLSLPIPFLVVSIATIKLRETILLVSELDIRYLHYLL